jgi:hypothetical protein
MWLAAGLRENQDVFHILTQGSFKVLAILSSVLIRCAHFPFRLFIFQDDNRGGGD